MRTTTLCSMSAAPSFVIAHILPPQNTIVNIFLSFFDKSKGKRNLRTGSPETHPFKTALSFSHQRTRRHTDCSYYRDNCFFSITISVTVTGPYLHGIVQPEPPAAPG